MSPVWLLPCTLTVLAAGALLAVARALRSESAALSEQVRGLSQLRERAHAVRVESERTAQAAALTLDTLAPPARQ